MNDLAKRALACGAQQLARLPLAPLARRCSAGDAQTLHVLTYHRVDWPDARPDLLPATLSAAPDAFAAQMECVREHFNAVDIGHVCEAIAERRPLPPRAVLITFDDAYRDFHAHAWPVLRRLQLPAVVFVPTRLADDPRRRFWWDRLHASLHAAPSGTKIETCVGEVALGAPQERGAIASKLAKKLSQIPHGQALAEVDRIAAAHPTCAPAAVMDWGELRQLASEGVDLAPHTRSHPLMNRIGPEQARDEAIGSRDDLLQNIGRCPPAFAYPGGAHDAATRAILAEAGFQAAFTTRRGANRLRRGDALQLRRINVGRQATAALVAMQLSIPPMLLNACCG